MLKIKHLLCKLYSLLCHTLTFVWETIQGIFEEEKRLQNLNRSILKKRRIISSASGIVNELSEVMRNRSYDNMKRIQGEFCFRFVGYNEQKNQFAFECAKICDVHCSPSELASIARQLNTDIRNFKEVCSYSLEPLYFRNAYPFIYNGLHCTYLKDDGRSLIIVVTSKIQP